MSDTPATTAPQEGQLERHLGLGTAIALGVGTTVGSGNLTYSPGREV